MLKKILKSLIPRRLRDHCRQLFPVWKTNLIWRLRRILGRRPYPRTPDGSVNVHLGCGRMDQPNFVNIDAIGFPHVHHLGPVCPLPMFGSDSVDFIYVSHCLEHIDIDEVAPTLREWKRVLKPGGKLRIGVPDFEAILKLYEASGRQMRAIHYILYGGQDYPFNYHRSGYDRAFLTSLLIEQGFESVQEWRPGQDALSQFEDCSSIRCTAGGVEIPVSLNLEAYKPASGRSSAN